VADTRALVFGDNAVAQDWFARVFSADVRQCIAAVTKAFNRYKDLSDTIALEKRPATVTLFVHAAVNSVLTSLHLFVSGFPIPAGQLMRHFAECIAMAMMCSDPSCGVYELYAADRRNYPVHKSLDLVTQQRISKALQKSLNMDKENYSKFAKFMKFYDHHSHASALTLGYSMVFTVAGGLVLGSQVDPSKKAQYKAELRSYSRACNTLVVLVTMLERVLPKRTA
jgi:hypothetical protein